MVSHSDPQVPAGDKTAAPSATPQPEAAAPASPDTSAPTSPDAPAPAGPEAAAPASADGSGRSEPSPPSGAPAPEPPATPRARLREASKTGALVEGRVVAIVRGGYEVDVEGVIALCPFNQMDLRATTDQLSHVHQTYPFKVTSYKQRGRRVLLSRRRLLEKEARKAEREAMGRIQPGAELNGVVTSLTDFGAFVDLGGVQGMIHVSEITHQRIARPGDKLKAGQTVRVKVLKTDKRKGRLSLSMKALEPDPWKAALGSLKTGTIAPGRLVRLTEFGAFVEVAPGVDGLIHASEIPAAELEAYKEKAAAGAEILVHVLKVESGKKRISLAPAPEGLAAGDKVEMISLRPGRIVEGKVEKVEKHGVIVSIGPGQQGIIPANETGTPRNTDLAQAFKPGAEIRALVLGAERGDRRARLSIRRAERQEEKRQLEQYRRSAASGAGSFATLGDFFRKDGSD